MWTNYLKIAWRNLIRNKSYTALNVVGLAVGFACCILIGIYVYGELSYDQYHEDANQIYRVESVFGDAISLASVNYPFVNVLETEYPELEIATLMRAAGNGAVRRGDRLFREEDILYANNALFEVFSFELEQGHEGAALTDPHTVLLTSEIAEKYFGNEDPIGRTLRLFGDQDFTVTGVLAEPAGPTHLPLNILLSWPTLESTGWSQAGIWGANNIYTYLRLPSEASATTLEASFPDLIERHAGESWPGSTLSLRPIPDIHLYSNHSAELAPGGNPAHVRLFAIVALFILLLAAVNFVNLATARSAERAREVGVRKASGADRRQLIAQHLCESVGLALCSGILAVGLARLSIPFISQLIGASFSLELLLRPLPLLALAGAILLIGLLAGAFPAFALSSYQPAEVLRGRFGRSRRSARLRQGLVVFQFTVAIALLVGTFIVYGQVQHLRGADLGFDESQVIAAHGPGATATQELAFFDALRAETAVESVSSSWEPMPATLLNGTPVVLPGVSDVEDSDTFTRTVTVSTDFFETLGVPLLAGRDFRAGSPADSASVIINEAAARQLMSQSPGRYDAPSDLVGETVQVVGETMQVLSEMEVLGVAENFHMTTLHSPIAPIAYFLDEAGVTYLVRTAPGTVEPALEAVQEHWSVHFPEAPLEYQFVDDAFEASYRAEEQFSRLAMLFAGLAMLVGCLGLYGLAAYAAERRRGEIGVRKVLGANVGSVVALLSRDFLKLVIVAFLLAVPIAYIGMSRWLRDFASHIDLSPVVFLLAGIAAVGVALLTVSYHALRAAWMNPTEAIRQE